MKLERHSPSSLNLFCASPALFVAERVLGRRQPAGAAMHRGTAVEAGIAAGLADLERDVEDCVEVAQAKYRSAIALCTDPRVEVAERGIPAMVRQGLAELRPYGTPSSTQRFFQWKPDGLEYPVVGYADFVWDELGIVVDLKTTEKLPSSIKIPHARQVAFYACAISDNIDARLSYVTPIKRATYRLENIREHQRALFRIAKSVENFLALSDDPDFFTSITSPDCESFYWNSPSSRQMAFEIWGV